MLTTDGERERRLMTGGDGAGDSHEEWSRPSGFPFEKFRVNSSLATCVGDWASNLGRRGPCSSRPSLAQNGS